MQVLQNNAADDPLVNNLRNIFSNFKLDINLEFENFIFNFYENPDKKLILNRFDTLPRENKIQVPKRNLETVFEDYVSNLFESGEIRKKSMVKIFLEISKKLRNDNKFIDDLLMTSNSSLNNEEIIFKELTLESIHDSYFNYNNIDYKEYSTSYSLYNCENCTCFFLSILPNNICDRCK